ncbi:MAG TPA: hypothetical protein VEU96_13750 [Bryobacteraceae bacterium]|nr:hypothetical protein [Bryobacteraceae bacterium]
MRLRKKLGAIALTMHCGVSAQQFVDADHIDKAKRAFNAPGAAPTLQCEIKPVQPALDFSMRLETGYRIRVPLNQFLGPGHGWTTLLQVTPSTGQPVYLVSTSKLPEVQSNNAEGEVAGGFVVGEGIYDVRALAQDDEKRTCHSAWRIGAKLGRLEQGLQPAMPPNTVGEISGPFLAARRSANPKIGRLTIFVHAAPRSRRLSISEDDTTMLAGMLSALMEQLPAREVRLVVFNLEQQRIVMRNDNFAPEEIENVSKAINEQQLASVDYSVVNNPKGTVDLLTGLVETEVRREKPSDAVIFLGSHSRTVDSIPALAMNSRPPAIEQFFYLQYKRPLLPLSSPLGLTEAPRGPGLGPGRRPELPPPVDRDPETMPDSIQQLMKRLKGRTMFLAKPHDFVEALVRLNQLAGKR